jgi:hypothetical protein
MATRCNRAAAEPKKTIYYDLIIMRQIIIISILTSLFSGCQSKEMKFDKNKWNEKDDVVYAFRENMVNDLMKNYLKKGMTYKEVMELLGKTEYNQNDLPNTIGYEIMVNYGWNIDPQKGETLYIEFTNDSTLKSVRLEKWEH